jgi:hypothetical protein
MPTPSQNNNLLKIINKLLSMAQIHDVRNTLLKNSLQSSTEYSLGVREGATERKTPFLNSQLFDPIHVFIYPC